MKPMGDPFILQSKTVTAPRMLALRHESADQRSNHGMRFPSDPSAGCERGAQSSADAQTGTGRTVGEKPQRQPSRASFEMYKTSDHFDGHIPETRSG